MSVTTQVKAENAKVVAPNDGVNVAPTAGIYIGGSGNVAVTLVRMDDGDSIVLTDLAAGIIHPLVVKRVWNTGTTATDIVAVY